MLPPVVTVDNMRRSDAETIAKRVSSAELMRRAAQGIYNSVKFVGRVAIVCGSGNNGGDGYALACILLQNGITPTVFRLSDKFSTDGLYYYRTAMGMGCEEGNINIPAPFEGYDIVVDCILGTGFQGIGGRGSEEYGYGIHDGYDGLGLSLSDEDALHLQWLHQSPISC